MSQNLVVLVGNVGKAELFAEEGKTPVLKFSLATNEKYTNKAGEKVEDVQWHRCQIWGTRATALAPHVETGSKVSVVGKLRYGSYEKEGVKHYTTDVIVDQFGFEGGGKNSSKANNDAPATTTSDEISF